MGVNGLLDKIRKEDSTHALNIITNHADLLQAVTFIRQKQTKGESNGETSEYSFSSWLFWQIVLDTYHTLAELLMDAKAWFFGSSAHNKALFALRSRRYGQDTTCLSFRS